VVLPWAAAPHVAAAAEGSTTILVLDVSGSMDDPAQIPPDFPQAAKLQADEDAVGRLLEQAHPGNRVPLSVIAGGLMGLPELISLRSDLNTYLQQQNIDPATLSKLSALKTAAAALLTAIQFERDHAGADDRVGIVTFSSDATVVAPPTPGVAGLNAAVQGLRTDGSTNIGAGLQSALDLLKDQANPNVILMTDGWNNDGMTNDQVLSGPVQRATAAKVPVCAIGIGAAPADVDQQLLLDTASRTGGGYHFVGAGAPLGGDLLACHHSLAGLSLGDARGLVHQGQVAPSPGFTVPGGHHRLTVTLSWPGSQLDARLTDPAGRPVDARYQGASIVRGTGVMVVNVANPAAGHWGMSVAGVQTAAGGDRFVASASTDGATASPHRDALVGSLSAPIDQTEHALMLTRTVTAVVAVALVALWLLSMIGRLFTGAVRRTPQAPATAGAPGAYGQYTPPAPSGYGVSSSGQPVYTPAPYSPAPSAPPRRRSAGRSCLGCLLYLVFAVDVLVLGGSAAALYLWVTPLLTFPK
jgi:hypothetical protein